MSRLLKVSNGDYRLQVQSGGNIYLDTGTSVGTVTITGNLDVKGTTTTVESTNTTVQDNILQLNYGQTGNGISSTLGYQSGIEIGRGNYSSAQLVFNEQVTHYDPVTSSTVNGTFVMKTADGNLTGLQVSSITNSGTTNFVFDLQNTNYTLRIANSPTYEQLVLNANDIPNKKYVTDYVSANNGQANVYEIHYPQVGTPVQSSVSTNSNSTGILFKVLDGSSVLNTRASISNSGLDVDYIRIGGPLTPSTITNTTANNLVLTATSNNINVDAIFNLKVQSGTPTQVSNYNLVYAKDPGTGVGTEGKSGIYFTNTLTTDELMSKNRAVLLSILL